MGNNLIGAFLYISMQRYEFSILFGPFQAVESPEKAILVPGEHTSAGLALYQLR